jgi:hypothetical protein
MTLELLIFSAVIIGRFLVPFTILRWPLAGVFLSIVADATDIMVFEKIGGPGPIRWEDYHLLDKFFDTYYLAFAAWAAWKWNDKLARAIALGLFAWRGAGVVLFEMIAFGTGELVRPLMFFAPNIFENFFIAWLIIEKVRPGFVLTKKSAFITLSIVTVPKMVQEYILHFGFQDQTWGFLRDNVFWWLY